MLSISKPLAAAQAQWYHQNEFTSPEQNYWKQGGTVVGEWQGMLADKFGLAGAVSEEHFVKLSEGQHPHTNKQMIAHRAVRQYEKENGKTVKPVQHRAGWDATFSAPKSISLTALVGGDERVIEAHRHAVSFALTELERYTQARLGGNKQAETTGKFVAAKFEHDTARPVDGYAAPQLHTHAVIFNMTERADGTMRALQPQSFYDSQQFATAVYQAELTYQLRTLGYDIVPGRSGAPEIKGYTQEYLDASSPRSKQIKEELERAGFAGPEAAQIAAHNTRDDKEQHSLAEVMAAHRRLAVQHGNQAASVVAAALERSRSTPREITPGPATRINDAVRYARERCFEREAVSDERALLRDALRHGMGELRYDEVRGGFDARVAGGDFLAVEAKKHATGRLYTTPETIAMERAAVREVQKGFHSVAPTMSPELAENHANRYERLNDGQRNAIREVLTSDDRVHGFQGLAGTGKTSTLAAIRAGAETNGYAVEGFAPTSKASAQLREAGISADTLQSFLTRGGHDRNAGDPNNRHFYMLDESSLASTQQMRDFLQRIGPQDRVLVIGDIRQHQGVDAGKPFEQMQAAGMPTTKLDQIVRQKDEGLLRAVAHLSRNETVQGIRLLQDQGRCTEVKDPAQRYAAIARDYVSGSQNTIIVSPDNASRREINQAVRVELQNQQRLDVQSYSVSTLIPRSDLTGADRRWAAKYKPGDVLHYMKGSSELGIAKGSYGRVVAVDLERHRITVAAQSGREVTYDPKRLSGIAAYQEIHRDFAKGERIQFTAPSRDMRIANRDLATVERIDDKAMTVRLDGPEGRQLTLSHQNMPHIDHGYAVTSHSSQGITAERVLVNMDTRVHPELINTRFAYVSVSRASHEAHLYTNDATALGQRLNHEVTKSSALEHSPVRNQAEIPSNVLQKEHDFGMGVAF